MGIGWHSSSRSQVWQPRMASQRRRRWPAVRQHFGLLLMQNRLHLQTATWSWPRLCRGRGQSGMASSVQLPAQQHSQTSRRGQSATASRSGASLPGADRAAQCTAEQHTACHAADSSMQSRQSSMQHAMQHTALLQSRQSSTVHSRAVHSMPCSTQHAEQTEQHAACHAAHSIMQGSMQHIACSLPGAALRRAWARSLPAQRQSRLWCLSAEMGRLLQPCREEEQL